MVQLFDVHTDPKGGNCNYTDPNSPDACYNGFATGIALTDTFAQYTIDFESLHQDPGWGYQPDPDVLDTQHVFQLIFQVNTPFCGQGEMSVGGQHPVSFDFWIDDLYFVNEWTRGARTSAGSRGHVQTARTPGPRSRRCAVGAWLDRCSLSLRDEQRIESLCDHPGGRALAGRWRGMRLQRRRAPGAAARPAWWAAPHPTRRWPRPMGSSLISRTRAVAGTPEGSNRGGVLTYNGRTQAGPGAPTYTTTGGTLNITENTGAISAAQYVGVVVDFDDCIDARAFTGVQFTISGSLSGCTVQYSTTDTEHDDATYAVPNPHATGPEGAYAPYADLTASQVTSTPTTISMPFNGVGAPSGGSPDGLALDTSKLDRVNWQLSIPAAAGGAATCTASLTVDDVKFYR